MNKQHNSQGFTLLEMSIVIVIIALLAAGVLVGKDLVKAAQMRAQISQIEELNSAVQSFETRYNCLPGDCNHAVRMQLGTAAGPGDNGNGNGILDANIQMTVVYGISTPELANFWYHLMNAHLLSGNYPGYVDIPGPDDPVLVPGRDTPATKLPGNARLEPWYGPTPAYANATTRIAGGMCMIYPPQIENVGWPIFERNSGHAVILASRCDGYPNALYRSDVIYALDSKMDDGLPYKGMVRGYMHSLIMWNSPALIPVYGEYTCIKNDAYDTESSTIEPADPWLKLAQNCSPVIQLSF